MLELREIVKELLSQMAPSREVRQYLQQFSDVEQSRFAVVKVGGGVLQDELDALASALAFLHRLGLIPIVLHGAGPQLDRALEEAGIATERHDGLRVTTEEAMAVVRPVIYRQNRRLVEALEARDIRTRGIQHGVFHCEGLDREKYGLVGHITDVDLESIRAAVSAGALPVVACLGETASGQVMNVNADIAARELVWAVEPHKIIFLTPTGGLLDREGRVISAVSLDNDYEHLMAQPWVHSGMRLKLQQVREMLERLPPSTSVSITSAARLTRELFTHGGAGTLIRRGELIREYETWDDDLRRRAGDAVEQAFGRTLREDWLEGAELRCVLMADSGRAAAVVLDGEGGVPYLDKFAVTPEARGEGLGAALWQSLCARFPKLYWRSRTANPINGWYFQQADTTHRDGHWVVFCMGVADAELETRLVRDALARDAGWVPETE